VSVGGVGCVVVVWCGVWWGWGGCGRGWVRGGVVWVRGGVGPDWKVDVYLICLFELKFGISFGPRLNLFMDQLVGFNKVSHLWLQMGWVRGGVGVGWWVWVGVCGVVCRVGWCGGGRGVCIGGPGGGGLPLRSNIQRSALCATLDTYNFNYWHSSTF
jgi:hypothetical protein